MEVGRDVLVPVPDLVTDAEAETVPVGELIPDVCEAGKLPPEDQVVGATLRVVFTVNILPLKPSWFGVAMTSVL